VNPYLNALGEPSPNRTDFSTWQRGSLERFARQTADENLLLRAAVEQGLRDLRDAMRLLRESNK
jgi:hypothetical protein